MTWQRYHTPARIAVAAVSDVRSKNRRDRVDQPERARALARIRPVHVHGLPARQSFRTSRWRGGAMHDYAFPSPPSYGEASVILAIQTPRYSFAVEEDHPMRVAAFRGRRDQGSHKTRKASLSPIRGWAIRHPPSSQSMLFSQGGAPIMGVAAQVGPLRPDDKGASRAMASRLEACSS
jgi:hypothetical protein